MLRSIFTKQEDVQQILEYNVIDLNMQDVDGNTPLHMLASAEMAKLLLFQQKQTILYNLVNSKGQTILMCNLQHVASLDLSLYSPNVIAAHENLLDSQGHGLGYYIAHQLIHTGSESSTSTDDMHNTISMLTKYIPQWKSLLFKSETMNNKETAPIVHILQCSHYNFYGKALSIIVQSIANFWSQWIPAYNMDCLCYIAHQCHVNHKWQEIFKTVPMDYPIQQNTTPMHFLLASCKDRNAPIWHNNLAGVFGLHHLAALPQVKRMLFAQDAQGKTPIMTLYENAIQNATITTTIAQDLALLLVHGSEYANDEANLKCTRNIAMHDTWSLFAQACKDEQYELLEHVILLLPDSHIHLLIHLDHMVPHFAQPSTWTLVQAVQLAVALRFRFGVAFLQLLANTGLFHSCVEQENEIAWENILQAHDSAEGWDKSKLPPNQRNKPSNILSLQDWQKVFAATNDKKETCLHALARCSNKNMIQACWQSPLHKCSTVVNMQDDQGNTALHTACAQENAKLIPLLIQSGAHTSIENNQKQVASALLRKDSACWKFFKKRTSKQANLPQDGEDDSDGNDDDDDFSPTKRKTKKRPAKKRKK